MSRFNRKRFYGAALSSASALTIQRPDTSVYALNVRWWELAETLTFARFSTAFMSRLATVGLILIGGDKGQDLTIRAPAGASTADNNVWRPGEYGWEKAGVHG